MAEYIEAKSLISKVKNAPDSWFGLTYNMNLYRGCQHQCIYCDSRSEVYNLGDLHAIRIKKNALELLAKELKAKRLKGTIGTGSMNDPYMPIEKTEQLTQKALETIWHYRFPVHVLTKSDLVTRDTQQLKDISKIYAAVSFTITTPNDSLSQQIEPSAPVTSKRLKAMEYLASRGIYTGALIMPVLPYLTDSPSQLKLLIHQIAQAGGQYILFSAGMTLRKGQREYYYQKLEEISPGLSHKYSTDFNENYNAHSSLADELNNIFKEQCQLNNMATGMQFYRGNINEQLSLF